MNIEDIKQYALSKKGTSADMPWGDDVVTFRVGSKIFIIMSEKDGIMDISLKCDPFIAEDLRVKYKSVIPGFHLNKRHWNTVSVDGEVPEDELKNMMDMSYELVFKGLKKAERNEIELGE